MRHNDLVKIFISSVRAGLEAERDALPGLIKALGHEPVRFEDFSAQPIPSRQACIEGVESSNGYLLLLGPHYGQTFPETGQSATHDEWVAAQRIGLPRYVFRKIGVDFDPEQQAFERTLGDYGSGRFYKTFADATGLQQAVAAAIREMQSAPEALAFEPLNGAVAIRWLADQNARGSQATFERPLLEVHVAPIGGRPLSGRLLEQALEGLSSQVRSAGLVSSTEALEATHEADSVKLSVPAPGRRSWGESHDGSLASVRILHDGQIAITFRLPGDQMGSILDPLDVAPRIATALRLSGQIDRTAATKIAVGVGINSRSMVTLGRAGLSPRNSSSMSVTTEPVHVEPDETMSRAALDLGADEVAATLTRSLIRAFENTLR